MGQEIVYCFKCLTRLTGGDFEKGRAFRHGSRISCKECLPGLLAELKPEELESFHRASRPADKTPHPPSAVLRPSTTRRRVEQEPAPSRGKGGTQAWILGGGAAALLVIVVVLLALGDPPAPPPPPPPPRAPVAAPPVRPPASPPENRRAREAIQKARQSGETQLDALLAVWTEAVKATEGTSFHAEAVDARLALLERRRAERAKEMEAVDAAAEARAAAGELAQAAAVYEAARGRHAEAEWGSALSDKVAALRREAGEAAGVHRDRGIEAARGGDAAAVRQAEEAVARLGYPELLAEFRAAVSNVKPPDKPVPPSAELIAYRAAWKKPVERAVARDFEAAIAAQTALARDLKEEEAKLEAARDLEDMVRLRELQGEIARIGERLPAGRDLAVEVFGDDGVRRGVQGRILRAWAGRIEVSGEPSVFVELGDLSAGSVADVLALVRRLSPVDSRALAFLASAEGDAERAARLFPSLQEKIRVLAKDGAARLPPRPEKEREVRKLFYDAERAYRDAGARAEAVALYRRLAADFADAGIVKGELDLVRRRAEEGREAFIAAEAFKAAGTFRPSKEEKLGSVWTSSDDSEAAKAAENFLEFEYLSVADSTYRAWVLAGGCCGEVFGFSWQASDLSGPRGAAAAPGSETHVPVRHGVTSVRPKHGDHLGPKAPKRWAWVALPLPRAAAPGVKRVRILTNQKGFSVACAFVSSLRTSPPGDADLRERLVRAREGAADPDLLAWWRLDEQGAEALGKIPALQARGSVEWQKEGKLGGSVRLSGGGWLEAPHHPALNAYPITACAWVRTTSNATGGVVNKYVSSSVNGWQIQLYKGTARAWYFREGPNRVFSEGEGLDGGLVNDGAWHHLAFAVDAAGGRLFVDGVLKASLPWSGTPGPCGTSQALSVGLYPSPAGGSKLDGSVDDVRIYARALSDAEIRALHAAGAGIPVETRPWTPLFDGKTASSLIGGGSEASWKVEGGALTRDGGKDSAGQSRTEIPDGEIRIRFETAGVTSYFFGVRQGPEGKMNMRQSTPADGPHEIVFLCSGDEVRATLDGKPVDVQPEGGRPSRGRLQFNFTGKSLRILSVEHRPLP